MAEHGCLWFPAGHPKVAELGLGAFAYRYAEMGYAVLPLERGGKRPHRMLGESGGVHWSTRNPVKIANWWKQDPAAGIGIACGQASQLLVIDLDVKGGHNGWAEFMTFLDAWSLPMPSTHPVAETPSGGQHYWLRTPEGWPVKQRLGILPGVDVKGDGGYVAAAPSHILTTITGGPTDRGGAQVMVPYRWVSGCPCSLPWAPEWVWDWISSAPAAVNGNGATSGGASPDIKLLQATGAPTGARNITVYRAACKLYAQHGTDSEADQQVWAEIRKILDATSRAGFTDAEVRVIMSSARAFITRRMIEWAAGIEANRGFWDNVPPPPAAVRQ